MQASKDTIKVNTMQKKNWSRKNNWTIQFFFADFGDVVTFDIMYRTNRYSMPLAMIVGCNNQLQNVVFVQAFIRDERTDTFEWVLN